jgi:hypothetical protein
VTPPTVVNRRFQTYTLYIGRPSKWGNRYSVVKSKFKDVVIVPTIEDALRRFEEETRASLWDQLHELSGHSLGCWCKPKPCHGDVLVKLFKERFGL